MKVYEKTIVVDTDMELQHIINFINDRWEGFDKIDIKEVFSEVWNQSLDASKYKMDSYGLLDLYDQWNRERNDYQNWQAAGTNIKKEQLPAFLLYDFINNFVGSLIVSPTTYDEIIMEKWDHEKTSKQIFKEIYEKFPLINNVRPKGWDSLDKTYDTSDGTDEYFDKQESVDRESFQGLQPKISNSYRFHTRVALPNVMYDYKEDDYNPFQVLVSAMLTQAYAVSTHNNTAKVLQELTDIKNELSSPEYFKNIVLNVDIESKIKSPVMKGLYTVMKDKISIHNENDFAQYVKDIESPEEISAEDFNEGLDKIINALRGEIKPEELKKNVQHKKDLSVKVFEVLEQCNRNALKLK